MSEKAGITVTRQVFDALVTSFVMIVMLLVVSILALDRVTEARSPHETARDAKVILGAIGFVGAAVAVGVGARITRRVRAQLTGVARSIDSAAAKILTGTAQQV